MSFAMLIALMVAASILAWSLVLSEEESKQNVIGLDCDGLRQHILDGNHKWEFAQKHYDLRCSDFGLETAQESAAGREGDIIDVMWEGDVQIIHE